MAKHRREPRGFFPTDEEIATLAYQLFLERAWSGGRRGDIWYEAETELLDRAARRLFSLYKGQRDDAE